MENILEIRNLAKKYGRFQLDSVLVADKAAVSGKHPEVVMDNASIDDILLLYVKGVQP